MSMRVLMRKQVGLFVEDVVREAWTLYSLTPADVVLARRAAMRFCFAMPGVLARLERLEMLQTAHALGGWGGVKTLLKAHVDVAQLRVEIEEQIRRGPFPNRLAFALRRAAARGERFGECSGAVNVPTREHAP